MTQPPPPPPGRSGLAVGSGSAAASEKSATSSASPTAAPSTWPMKPRSCVVCRSRKVRCDKQSPCSNCRRANVACVVPSNDRPPRWARRLERITNNAASTATPHQDPNPVAGQVMERLRNLETLVKDLSVQLEQATAATSPTPPQDSHHQTSVPSNTGTAAVQNSFGRLVLQDESQSRYVGSGFWSRVSDELDGLKMGARELANGDSDTSEDEDSAGKTPSTQELERTPSERHAFLFRHNLGTSGPDLREFRPLPSQIPFLLDTFSENVNLFVRTVHMPSVAKMMRQTREGVLNLTPVNEALMFSIYYAAVTSMEDEDVMANFGSTKADLNLKYRLGLEHALAKADFLNAPELVLVQAFAIFLFLARRHDSPRFVWMMAGLAIRMAQSIGLHRDGSHFKHLSPFEVEMRRRVWWGLCVLDIRASEDQGTDFTIAADSFDTKLPLNVDDSEIGPEIMEPPPSDRQGLTDMSLPLVWLKVGKVTRKMMAPAANGSGPTLEEQTQLLSNMYEALDQGYLQYATESNNITYWVGVTTTRLVVSKMTLLIYLPTLFSSPSERFSNEVRDKLLVAAIEVAEYNHALNAEQNCRQWRWIYQTYTHWYAIVYMLIEISRRPWSPIIERAWVALHSSWLIPVQTQLDKKLQFWVPLRKLMAKARHHRKMERERLRNDATAVEQLEMDDRNMPTPASSGPFPNGRSEELFRERWRILITGTPAADTSNPTAGPHEGDASQEALASGLASGGDGMWPTPSLEPGDRHSGPYQGPPSVPIDPNTSMSMNPLGELASGQTPGLSNNIQFGVPAGWSGGQSMGLGFTPWFWPDIDISPDQFDGVDVNMDMGEDVDWNTWLQSATDMDRSR